MTTMAHTNDHGSKPNANDLLGKMSTVRTPQQADFGTDFGGSYDDYVANALKPTPAKPAGRHRAPSKRKRWPWS